jgi:hypothetical protein
MPPDSPAASSPPSTSAASLDPNAGSITPAASSAGQQPAPSEYWGKGWAKDDGAFDHTRFDKAPTDLQPLKEEMGRYKSLDDLLKSHKSLRELASKKGIAEPLGKEATPEQRSEHMALVRKALGAPDKLEGYVLQKPENVPAEMWQPEIAAAASKLALEEGVSPAALQKFAALQLETVQKGQVAQKAAMDQMWAEQDQLIRETVAKDGLDYGKAKALAERAGAKWGVAADSPLMQNATVFMLLTRLGKAGAEDRLITGDNAGDGLQPTTPEAALKVAKTIQGDRSHADWGAYWNRDEKTGKEIQHPRHDEVVAKVNKLLALGYKDRPMRK